MKRLILAFFIFVPNWVIAQFFSVSTSVIKTDTQVIAVADWGQQLYCLQADRTFLRIDTVSRKAYKHPIKLRTLYDLYCESDTLFGVTDQDFLYYFDGDDFCYTGRKKAGNALYMDAEYKVMGSCSGEFGGTVYFINRQTGKKFACSATCPVMVNKSSTGYVVTASLAHLMGSTEILNIPDPEQMREYNYKPGRRKVLPIGDSESHSRQGVTKLVDSTGVFTLGSYLIDGEILHVVTNFRETFICRISNGAFETIQQISDSSFWTYRRAIWYNKDGAGVTFFLNHESNGFLRIAGRDIRIYRFGK